MTKNTQSGQGSSQSQSQTTGKFNQQELEEIIRGGKFTSQSDANSYLQRHGLSCQMREDGSADIYDGQQNRLAQVQFSGSQSEGQNRTISGINY